jgi:hypothetical protein
MGTDVYAPPVAFYPGAASGRLAVLYLHVRIRGGGLTIRSKRTLQCRAVNVMRYTAAAAWLRR